MIKMSANIAIRWINREVIDVCGQLHPRNFGQTGIIGIVPSVL